MVGVGIEPVYQVLGRRIAALRRERGLTQDRLAVAAAVSTNYLARVEGGQHRATLPKLVAIAAALSVDLSALFQEGPAEQPSGLLPELSEGLTTLSRDDQRLLAKLVGRFAAATSSAKSAKRVRGKAAPRRK